MLQEILNFQAIAKKTFVPTYFTYFKNRIIFGADDMYSLDFHSKKLIFF